MNFNRNSFLNAQVACLFLSLILRAPIAAALPVLQINGDGELTGANGVDVGGLLYDVAFVDGVCADIFEGCDEKTDFIFGGEDSAEAAAQALLDQVFVDSALGSFDTVPRLTLGCEGVRAGARGCSVVIPVYPLTFGNAVMALNSPSQEDQLFTIAYNPLADLSGPSLPGITATFAVFKVTAVPAPAAAWLFLSAFGCLIGVRVGSG